MGGSGFGASAVVQALPPQTSVPDKLDPPNEPRGLEMDEVVTGAGAGAGLGWDRLNTDVEAIGGEDIAGLGTGAG